MLTLANTQEAVNDAKDLYAALRHVAVPPAPVAFLKGGRTRCSAIDALQFQPTPQRTKALCPQGISA
jgi:hypothetical protein